jgi:hypothetical protein
MLKHSARFFCVLKQLAPPLARTIWNGAASKKISRIPPPMPEILHLSVTLSFPVMLSFDVRHGFHSSPVHPKFDSTLASQGFVSIDREHVDLLGADVCFEEGQAWWRVLEEKAVSGPYPFEDNGFPSLFRYSNFAKGCCGDTSFPYEKPSKCRLLRSSCALSPLLCRYCQIRTVRRLFSPTTVWGPMPWRIVKRPLNPHEQSGSAVTQACRFRMGALQPEGHLLEEIRWVWSSGLVGMHIFIKELIAAATP